MTRDGSHAKLAYDWYGSWTTLYSLYPAALLCFQAPAPNAPTNFIPFLRPQLFANQSLHYANVMQKYGTYVKGYSSTTTNFFQVCRLTADISTQSQTGLLALQL